MKSVARMGQGQDLEHVLHLAILLSHMCEVAIAVGMHGGYKINAAWMCGVYR